MKKRKTVIKDLKKYASKLAKIYGFTELNIGDDRQKGVWGESFTSLLEKKYGECTEEIRWSDKDNEKNFVQFRYRFHNPCVCISINERNTLVECEIGCGYKEEDGNVLYDNVFRPKSFTAWGEGCVEIIQMMKTDIEKITIPMSNKFFGHETKKRNRKKS